MNATQDERRPFSTKLTNGARTYYLDIKKTCYDNTYMQITESLPRSDGDVYKQNRVFVFSEDYESFFKSLVRVYHFLKSHPEAMRPDKKHPPCMQPEGESGPADGGGGVSPASPSMPLPNYQQVQPLACSQRQWIA